MRVINAFVCDGFSGNLRAERFLLNEASGRTGLGLLCDAHRKATVSTLSFSTIKPLDTQLIRFALTLQGGAMCDFRKEMRQLLKEQLVVIKSGLCSREASLHRERVYDLFVPGASPSDKYRRELIGKLFNGDIRRRGR
eukprot:3214158-Pyramimonas_sp.AAC.1